MSNSGITFSESDRDGGPFKIRIGGTNEFVSAIDPVCSRSWPPGNVDLVEGWDNHEALTYDTMDEALADAKLVRDIEGFHTSIEAMRQNLFNVGDLVKLNRTSYPQYDGYLGSIVSLLPGDGLPGRQGYQVLIAGRLHPYRIFARDMTNETEDGD